MARKKVGQKVVVTLPDGDENDDDKTATEQEVDDALERAESEVPSKVESRIFRSHPATGNREAYTDTVDSDAVTTEFLRQQYGGGKYRVQVVGPVPKGKAGKPGRGVLRVLRFDVDPSVPPKHPAQFAAVIQAPSPNAPAPPSSSIDVALATMIMGMVKQMGEGTTALQTMQMQMMQDHSKMLAAQLANLAPKPERDPLEVLKEAAAIIRPNEKSGFGEFLEQYKLFKEIAGDAEAKDTSWLDVIKEVAPTLVDAAARRDGVRVPKKRIDAAAHGTTPRLPSGTGQVDEHDAGVQGADVTPVQPNVNPNLRFITPIMPRVLKWATQGKDANLCAEWLLSDIPAGFFPMLREQLSSPTFVEDVVVAFPAADPFRLWIGQLRDVLVENTAPETDDEPDAEGDDTLSE